MHSAYIALAHGKGFVTIERERDPIAFDVTDGYEVKHYAGTVDKRTLEAFDTTLLDTQHITAIEGEEPLDTKARALGAVRQLAHWPRLVASISAERRARSAIDGTRKWGSDPSGTRPSGLWLP